MMTTASRGGSDGLVFADCAGDNFEDGEVLTFDLFISNSIYLCRWGNGYFPAARERDLQNAEIPDSA